MELAKKFDGVDFASGEAMRVTEAEFEAAVAAVDEATREALEIASGKGIRRVPAAAGNNGYNVTGIDFRRGDEGQARVIVSLDRLLMVV